jgi:hypothetical protein
MLLGACVGVVLSETIIYVKHHQFLFGLSVLSMATGFAAASVGIAEWMGKVKSIRELERPLTLFPPE